MFLLLQFLNRANNAPEFKYVNKKVATNGISTFWMLALRSKHRFSSKFRETRLTSMWSGWDNEFCLNREPLKSVANVSNKIKRSGCCSKVSAWLVKCLHIIINGRCRWSSTGSADALEAHIFDIAYTTCGYIY